MSTIYILEPDDSDRKDAINALMDSLDKLYPDELITRHALAVTTNQPEILQLLTGLAAPDQAPLPNAGAPASPGEKPKARRPAPRRKHKPGDSSPSSPAPAPTLNDIVEDLIGDPPESTAEKNAAAPQIMRWRILDSGKEISDPYYLLKNRRLAVGCRLRHKERGIYVVTQEHAGEGLSLRRLAS